MAANQEPGRYPSRPCGATKGSPSKSRKTSPAEGSGSRASPRLGVGGQRLLKHWGTARANCDSSHLQACLLAEPLGSSAAPRAGFAGSRPSHARDVGERVDQPCCSNSASRSDRCGCRRRRNGGRPRADAARSAANSCRCRSGAPAPGRCSAPGSSASHCFSAIGRARAGSRRRTASVRSQ